MHLFYFPNRLSEIRIIKTLSLPSIFIIKVTKSDSASIRDFLKNGYLKPELFRKSIYTASLNFGKVPPQADSVKYVCNIPITEIEPVFIEPGDSMKIGRLFQNNELICHSRNEFGSTR